MDTVLDHKTVNVDGEKGTYALLLSLEREVAIAVGRLGLFTFPCGYYIYVGSARGGLFRRVERHLRREKRLRWHIDYFLRSAEVVEVWYALGEEPVECLWCCAVRGMPRGRILVPGFGSSDCRCSSHLVWFPSPPSFELFRKALGDNGSQLKRATPSQFLG